MIVDSIIIKIKKYGVGTKPDYTLLIYGNGKTIYRELENEKIKKTIDSSIDDDKVVSILEEFRNADFFSLNDSYIQDDGVDGPSTTISILIPKENGENITKKVSFQQNYQDVPKGLLDLSKKIESIVEVSKWFGKKTEIKRKEQKITSKSNLRSIPKKSSKKLNKKLVAISVISIIIIILVGFSVYSGIISLPTGFINQTDHDDIISGDNLDISSIETSKDFDLETGEYTTTTIFFPGNNISIISKLNNFSTVSDEYCDLYLQAIVELEGHIYYHNYTNRTKIGKGIQVWWFEPAESWPTGMDKRYNITVMLTDKITNNSTISEKFFFII